MAAMHVRCFNFGSCMSFCALSDNQNAMLRCSMCPPTHIQLIFGVGEQATSSAIRQGSAQRQHTDTAGKTGPASTHRKLAPGPGVKCASARCPPLVVGFLIIRSPLRRLGIGNRAS